MFSLDLSLSGNNPSELKRGFCSKPKIIPFVKWAGGKRKILPYIMAHVPNKFDTYYEPFLGGGALFLHLQPERFVINDSNDDLIGLYHIVRDNINGLLAELSSYINEKDFYYTMRELDRNPEFADMHPVKKAARFLYLNKTCFNGLHRVNSHGYFNVPFGNSGRKIFDERTLRSASDLLNVRRHGLIQSGDFEAALEGVSKDDFVYLDPPYDYVENANGFTKYTRDGFDRDDQIRLKLACDKLNSIGCKFLLSNSATGFIKDLYRSYHKWSFKAPRCIDTRIYAFRKVEEFLIWNY